jgi:GNAT superfamily N-acetyltransferase
VDMEEVRAFFEAHPHPNVLEPLLYSDKKRYIAVYDGDAVVATATLERNLLAIDQLGGMLVDPDRRGAGVGRILMDAVVAEARCERAQLIACGVYRRDPDVSPFYRAMGFNVLAPFIPGVDSPWPFGAAARLLAKMFHVEAGPDAIRIMARRP